MKRRKQLEKIQPISANDVVGSIISLDKLFEEKDLPTQTTTTTAIIDPIETIENNDNKLKIFEGDKLFNSQRLPHQRHARSSSYDVKITRSNSSNSDVDRLRKMRLMSHTRTNSRDYEIVNNQLNNQQNANIKYIVNHLKKPMGNLNSNFNLNRNFNGRRRHMRNHSYGQEFSFLPNNAIIRLDNDLANKFLLSTSGNNSRHHSRKNSYDKSHTHHHHIHHHVDLNLLHQKLANQKINDDLYEDQEDLEVLSRNPIVSSVIAEEDTILRHRRTNSKDLNSSTIDDETVQNPPQALENTDNEKL